MTVAIDAQKLKLNAAWEQTKEILFNCKIATLKTIGTHTTILYRIYHDIT